MLKNAMVCPTIPASDMGRAQKFYQETLGLEADTKMSGEHFVLYRVGEGTALALYESGGAGSSTATYASFKVDDLEAEMKDLRAKGVEFEEYDFPGLKTVDGVATDETGKAAWFKDSEGNILCLNEM